uniref:histidine kinase n=1 Tax=Dunaliella tertiolecta TaxID=3047 RepID=A0A7S3VM44_DUNTE
MSCCLLLLFVTACTTGFAQLLHAPAEVSLLRSGLTLTFFLHLVGVLPWVLPSLVTVELQWLLSAPPLWLLLRRLVNATSRQCARALPLRRAAAADLLAAAAAVAAAILPAGWTRLLQVLSGTVALLAQAKLLHAALFNHHHHNKAAPASQPPQQAPLTDSPGPAADATTGSAAGPAATAETAAAAAAAPSSNGQPTPPHPQSQHQQQQPHRCLPGCFPRPSQVTLLMHSLQAVKTVQLAASVLGGLGITSPASGTGFSVWLLSNLVLTIVWPQVAAIYVLMLRFACKVTQKQQRLLRMLVKLPKNRTFTPDLVGNEGTLLLEVLLSSAKKRSSSEQETEDDTPRPSLEDLDLDLGSLYRISEGSERTQQDPDIGPGLQHLLLVACSGSDAGQGRSRANSGSSVNHEGRASAKISLDSQPAITSSQGPVSPRMSLRMLAERREGCWTEQAKQHHQQQQQQQSIAREEAARVDASVQCEEAALMPLVAAQGGGVGSQGSPNVSTSIRDALANGVAAAAGVADGSQGPLGSTQAAPDDSGREKDARLLGLVGLVATLQSHASDVAHDLKNPLNGVLALSQNVMQGSFGELPPAASKQLGVVNACGHHLLNMINMARDMLRGLDGGDWDLSTSKVQVSTPIDEVLNRMNPMVGNRITVQCNRNEAHMVVADGARLYQVVHVVLVNAFKYTRKGSVSIDSEAQEGTGHVTIRVTDTGPGFTPEQLEKYNAPLNGEPGEQVGLGLMMVRRLMAGFGGALRVRNAAEEGQQQPPGACVELVFRAERDVGPVATGLPSSTSIQPGKQPATSSMPAPQAAQQSQTPPAPNHGGEQQQGSLGGGTASSAAAAAAAAWPLAVGLQRD